MVKCFPAIRRLVVFFVLGIGLAMGASSARGQPMATQPSDLPPLRIPDLPVGAHCFGLNPCTFIDPFGLRLRAAVLAAFRPEKGHDRDFYAARIQLAPSITLMQWAEFGVAIPITLYSKEIGVTAVYEPLQPFGRVRIPLEGLLGGVATTAFVQVHIASGPFVGGLPPLPGSGGGQSAMPDLMAQAIQAYRSQMQFEAGLAFQKRIGPVSATGSIGASASTGRLEIYGGGELVYRFSIVALFVQGQGIGVPRCPPEEAALNFCARGFRFGAGARFDWDLGAGGIMVATGSGAVEPGWEVGGQFGLDYDETTRRRHGDGSDAAHAWWERRFEAMARGWATWKSATAVWEDEDEALRRVHSPRRGPFSGILDGAAPPPSSPWLDGLLDDDAPPSAGPLSSERTAIPNPPQQVDSSTPAPQAQKGRPSRHGPHRRSLFAEANARAAVQRQFGHEPRFALPGSVDWMSDEELAHQQWQVVQEELRRAEQQRWRESPDLPPISKALLNGLARVPYGVASGFFMGSPDGARQVTEIWNRLRPVPYTPQEQQLGETMEEIVSFAGEMAVTAGSGALVKAETISAELAMRAGARESARQVGRQALFEAAERATLSVAESTATEAAELGGSRVSEFLANARARLNPMNYRVCGVGCGGGGIEFKPPKLPAAAATDAAAAAETELGSVVEHEAPLLDRPVAPYKRPSGATTPAQRAAVQGKPCVDCGTTTQRQVADHKVPLVKEHYETGAIDKDRMRSLDAVQPQCPTCSNRQGAELSRYGREQRQLLEGKEP